MTAGHRERRDRRRRGSQRARGCRCDRPGGLRGHRPRGRRAHRRRHPHRGAARPWGAARHLLGGAPVRHRVALLRVARPRAPRPAVALARDRHGPPARRRAAAVMVRSLDDTVAGLGADGDAWRTGFGPMADDIGDLTSEVFRPIMHVPSASDHARNASACARSSPRPCSARRWHGDEARALFAGVAAHSFQPLHRPTTTAVGVMMIAAGHARGGPSPKAGRRPSPPRWRRCSTTWAARSRPVSSCGRCATSPRAAWSCSTSRPRRPSPSPATSSQSGAARLRAMALRAGGVQDRPRGRGRCPVGQRELPTGGHRPLRRHPRRDRRGRARPPRRAHARSTLRARRPAAPRRPGPLQRRPPPGVGVRPRAPRLHRRRHRRGPRPDRAVRPRPRATASWR